MALYDPPGKTILMHNRMGLRIELSFDSEGSLEIWLSPKAGRSLDYHDRNFSCRDDHTRLFDRIAFPDLASDGFVRCNYDPFHSTIIFKRQKLHILSLYDYPTALIWFEKPAITDFKSDKSDRTVARSSREFGVEHPDRGKKFVFAAVLAEGSGVFRHQLVMDDGRSVYARAELAPGQGMAISGELSDQSVLALTRRIAGMARTTLLEENEQKVREAIGPGSFRLRGQPRLQELLDLNKRILLSMQDASGAIRAAINRIYYLIWVRDGAMIACFNAYSGWTEPLRKWTQFLLANPTVVKGEKPEGRTFLQLVSGGITKWEEDGVFYAIWSAFTLWTQSGDDRFVKGRNLQLLKEAMNWLERHTLDAESGLFGRYFTGEDPLPGARGDGWDNAVGRATTKKDCRYRGKSVQRSFDIYINLTSYSCYIMLASMSRGKAAGDYLLRAENLAGKLTDYFGRGLPQFGDLLTVDGLKLRAQAYGIDPIEYTWGLTLPLFYPESWKMSRIHERLWRGSSKAPERFPAVEFSLLCALDEDAPRDEKILELSEETAEQSYPAGEHLAMPNTIKEVLDTPDRDPYHDIRPQGFSIAPWLAAMVGSGLRRLPFGIAVRSTRVLSRISDYEYKKSRIDVSFSGKGVINSVKINGEQLVGSLQLPESMLVDGKTKVEVRMAARAPGTPCLLSSTVRLEAVRSESDALICNVYAYGKNLLVFVRHRGMKITVKNGRGEDLDLLQKPSGKHLYVEFAGRGRHRVIVT